MRTLLSILLISAILFTSCSDDESNDVQPQSQETGYVSENFEANTLEESTILAQLTSLTSIVNKGRNGDSLDLNEILTAFAAGDPSLETIASGDFSNDLKNIYFTDAANSSAKAYSPFDTIDQGGVYGAYLFNANGIEPEQIVDKGLYGAALYNRAASIMNSTNINSEGVDRLVALFGTTPEFPNTNNISSTLNPDRFLANYAARRDKNDGTGLYTQIKAKFIELKALTDDENSNIEDIRNTASELKVLWEKCNAATAINYVHSVISKMSGDNLSDDDRASAMHSYSEAVAFLYGWKYLSSADRMISSEDLDEVLTNLLFPGPGQEESFKLNTDTETTLNLFETEVLPKLQSVYGFSDQEMEDFAKNWISEQGR